MADLEYNFLPRYVTRLYILFHWSNMSIQVLRAYLSVFSLLLPFKSYYIESFLMPLA
jgi:hypothetical protein